MNRCLNPQRRTLTVMPDETPIFARALGTRFETLPPVLRKHYAIRPRSRDALVVSGTLTVESRWWVRLLARVTGMLVPFNGDNVPVTVTFTSDVHSDDLHFVRVFHFMGRRPHTFRSRMRYLGDGEFIEIMRFGIGWRFAFDWFDDRIVLRHRGYGWQLPGLLVPLPLSLVIGVGEAEETAVSDDTFAMWTHTRHRWFGRCFGYHGSFHIESHACPDPS